MDPAQKSQDIDKAERERKKRDSYTVFNPTNQDFQVVLNAAISPEVWTIKAKEEAIVPAYVADKYFEEMSQKIITSKSDNAVIEENEKRVQKGFPKMDLYTEQPRFEGRNLKNLMGKRERIIAILNRGLYQEYGIGKQEVTQIDKRDQRKSFDPGVSIEESQPAAMPASQDAPQRPETPEPPKDTVVSEPDEETEEERKERIHQQRIVNIAKAREAKRANL